MATEPTNEERDEKLPEAVKVALREAYFHHYREGREMIISKDGQLVKRQIGKADVVLRQLPPHRKVTIAKKSAT